MRLQRALARAGISSRRGAETLIREGRVRVNGTVAGIGASVDPARDVITVGGRRVRPAAAPVWIALHKPVGMVVSRSDERRRPTVFDIVPKVPALTYVGRLDVMTSGLLLLTTDGEAVHRLTHPRFAVERTYRVLVHGRSESEIRELLRRSVIIEGRRVNLVRWRTETAGRSTDVLLVLAEGRHRIVRRLCESLGLKVERLVRLSYGPVRLGSLKPGEWRYLTRAELRALDA
ncbi:MAG TPA: pseudouridine synthase [Gemmatimonadales bacterium]|nr:pseudouridine synthase [Gemmatimonadales bacterium]